MNDSKDNITRVLDGYIQAPLDHVIKILDEMLVECRALPWDHPKRGLVTQEILDQARDSGLQVPYISLAVIGELRRRLGYMNAIDKIRDKDWNWLA